MLRCFALMGMLGTAMLGTASLPGLLTQSDVPKPSFEVASVKPSATAASNGRIGQAPGGRLVADNASLTFLIRIAYRVRDFQIIGGPGWMATDRWDVEAKAEERSVAPPAGQDPNAISGMDLRLQSLLEDRFQLKLHHETRELPLYILTVVKSGPRMRAGDRQAPFPDQAPPPAAPSPVGTDGGLPPGFFRIQPGMVVGNALSLPQIVYVISQLVGRTVTDKTDLNGNFDVRLQFDPQSAAGNRAGPGGVSGPAVGPAGASDPTWPSIFTAIQEQLGLKLESTRGPVDVLVVDSVQKPTEN